MFVLIVQNYRSFIYQSFKRIRFLRTDYSSRISPEDIQQEIHVMIPRHYVVSAEITSSFI